MWIVPALIGFAVLAWLGYAWINALLVKYEHTPESVAVLCVGGAGSLYSGWRTAVSIAPAWSTGPKSAIALGVGFTLFSIYSFIVVNLWTAFLTRRFDDAEAALADEEDSILRKLQAMRWESYHSAGVSTSEKPHAEDLRKEDPREGLLRAVEAWEQGGGAARIRSLKVLEWREEASAKGLGELRDDIRSFEAEIVAESDQTKKEQLKVRLAVAKLALLERAPSQNEPSQREFSQTQKESSQKEPSGAEFSAGKAPGPEIKADEVAMRERLQEIHREAQSLKNAKAQYLRSRVKLSWRVVH